MYNYLIILIILFNWSRSLYSNEIVPVLFFLFLIDTFKPIWLVTDDSNCLKFGSFSFLITFLVLKILTKFSDCLTDNFFSTIFFATKPAFSNPTNTFAWPCVNFLVSIKFWTSLGRESNLKELDIC